MKRVLWAMVVFAVLFSVTACGKNIASAPDQDASKTRAAAVPPPPGCLSPGDWTALSYRLISGVPATGYVPYNQTGNYVIRTQADWDAYVAGSSEPGLVEPLPFDPTTQMLLVIGNASVQCSHDAGFLQVCYGASQVVAYTETRQACCGAAPMPGLPLLRYSLGIVVPLSGLPVVWSDTYIPMLPLCM